MTGSRKLSLFVRSLSAGLMLAAACSTPPETPPPVIEEEEKSAELEVGEEGGSVAVEGTVLTIPPGAVPPGTSVKVVETTSKTVEGFEVAGRVFRFEPAGLRFSTPAQILFPLTTELPNATVFWSNDEGGFSPLLAQRTAEGLVAEVHHFSLGFVGTPDDDACESVVCLPKVEPYCDPERPTVAVREFLPVCQAGTCEAPRTEVDCALAANATGACEAGLCVVASCNAGFGDCDGVATNGCETDLTTSSACGACGVVCEAGVACVAGACEDGAVAAVPGAPTSVTATAGVREATVTWTAPASDGGSPITNYLVKSPEAAGVSVQVTGTTAVVSALDSGIAYTFTVTAFNAVGEGPASAPSNAVTPTAPLTVPTAPVDVVATAGDASATVIWTAPDSDGGSPITGYVVVSSPGGIRVETTQTSALVTGLDNGVAYTFTVTALNAVGEGPASAPSTAITPVAAATIPDAPTNVVAIAGDSTATVSWAAPFNDGGSPILGYFVRVSDGRELFVVGTTATIEGLTNGVEYTFVVRAATDAGESDPSEVSNPIVPQSVGPTIVAPAAPTGVTAVAGNQSAVVSWVAPADDGGSPVLGYTLVASNGASAFATSSPATFTGLQNGVAYTFTVSAANAAGQGQASAPSNEITPAGLPGVVRDLVVSAGDETATVAWTAPEDDGGSGLLGYSIVASSGESRFVAASPAVFDGLTNGQTYTFTVSAVNGIGKGQATTSAGVEPTATTPPPTTPGAPLLVDAVAGDASASVTWSAPTSDGGSPILSYAITSVPAGATATAGGDATSALVEGLTNGVAYAFVVVATNAQGDGPASAPSNQVVPAEEVPPATPPSAPRNVVATRGNAMATVTWDLPATNGGSSITGYEVTASNGATRQADRSPMDFDGLTNGETYTFTVIARNAAGDGETSAPSNPVTPATFPDAPTGVVATAGDAQATVSWVAPVSDGGSALVGFLVETVGGNSLFVAGSLRSTTITALDNGVPYRFTVRAINELGQGAASAPSNEVTPEAAQAPATRPGAPTQVEAVAATNAAQVSWLAPADDGGSPLLGYYVETGADSRFTASSPYNFTGLSSDTGYVFAVSAVNALGRGPASAPSNSVTPLKPVTAPQPPTQVVATLGAGGLTVTWTPPTDDGGSPIVGYRVTPSQGETRFVTGTSATFATLVAGASYTFTVKAVNAQGESTPSTPSDAVTWTTVPGAPLLVQATPLDASAVVSWTRPDSDGGAAITSYKVTASPGGAQATVDGGTFEALVSGLTNGTAYTFTVTATNARGTGSASAASSPVTPAAASTPPGAPRNVQATPLDASALVSWTRPDSDGGAAITSYKVTASPGGAQATVDGGTFEALISGLTNGTAYTFTVTATNARGSGPASAASSPVTPEADTPVESVPGAPPQVVAAAGDASATVVWTAPTETGGLPLLTYVVEGVRMSDGSLISAVVDAGETRTVFTDLFNDEAYVFTVKAVNALGEGLPSQPSRPVVPQQDWGTGDEAPSAPTQVVATAGPVSASVSWQAPPEEPIDFYEVRVWPGGYAVQQWDVGTTHQLVEGLEANVGHVFEVRAHNHAGAGAWSEASNLIVTEPPALEPPQNVFASVEGSAVRVSWQPSWTGPQPLKYAVSILSLELGFVAEVEVEGWATDVVLPDLEEDVTYFFTVKTLTEDGWSADSAPSNEVVLGGSTGPVRPSVPRNVTAQPQDAAVLVSWQAPLEGAPFQRYEVRASPGGEVRTEDRGGTSLTFNRLQNGMAYTFEVRAFNAQGAGDWSSPTAPVVPGQGGGSPVPPGAPRNVVAVAGNMSATVSWDPPASDGGATITEYRISWDGIFGGGGSRSVSGTTTSTTVTNLQNGLTHQFTVRALNAAGTGPGTTSAPVQVGADQSRPRNVQADPADGAANITWEPVQNYFGDYLVTASPGGSSHVTSQTWLFFEGLTNGVTYTFTVRTTGLEGDGEESEPSSPVVIGVSPGAPQQVVAAVGAEPGTATVSWLPPEDEGSSPVESYRVYASPDAPPVDVPAWETTALFEGLAGGTPYTFTVVAISAIGEGTPSDPSNVVVPERQLTLPGAPYGVYVMNEFNGVRVTWMPPADDGGSFMLEYRVRASPGDLVITTADTLALFEELTGGVTYTFTVEAFNELGTGPVSEPSQPLLVTSRPDPVRNIAAVAGDRSATVSWDEPANTGGLPITGYRVTRMPSGQSTILNAQSRSHTATNLTNGVEVWFTVEAQNERGWSDSIQSPRVTPRQPPGAPLGVQATPGDERAFVSWSAPLSAGDSPITHYTVTAIPGGAIAIVQSPTRTATVEGLTNGTPYQFTVRAESAAGVGPASTPSAAITPFRPAVPEAPTNVRATAGRDRATVEWDLAGTGGHPILANTITVSPGDWTVEAPGEGTTSFVVEGLVAGTAYSFRVAATNTVGTGPQSEASTPVVPSFPPDPPEVVTAAPSGASSILVSWELSTVTGGLPLDGFVVRAYPGARVMETGPDARTALFEELTNGVGYSFTVAAVNGAGEGAASGYSAAVPALGVPSAPIALQAVPGDRAITLTWQPPADTGGAALTGYVVSVDGTSLAQEVTGTSAVVSDLTSGVPYTLRVVAKNMLFSGPAATTVATPGARPGPPTGVFAAIDDWSRIDLTWEPPVSDGGFPVTSYEVEIFNDGISDTYVVPATSPLELRDEYLFHDPWNDSADNKVLLRAVNSLGAGEPVELSLLANVVPAKPGATTPVRGHQELTYNWIAPQPGTSPIVEYVVTLMPGNLVRRTTATSMSFSGLDPDATYTARVSARNESGFGPFTQYVGVKPAGLPSEPRSVSRSIDYSQPGAPVTLSWAPPLDTGGVPIDYYQVEVQGYPYGFPTTTSMVINGLEPGYTYTLSVKAANEYGTGPSANTQVRLAEPPGAPRNPRATILNPHQISIAWDPPENDGGAPITHYRVVDVYTGESRTVYSNTVAIYSTEPGKTHSWVVHAANEAGESAASAASTPTTVLVTPGAPQWLTVEVTWAHDGQANAILRWNPPSDTGGGIERYTVTATWAGGSRAGELTGAPPATSMEFLNLPAPTPVTFTVTAHNAAGSSAPGSYTIGLARASRPPAVSVTPGDGQLTVAWQPPTENGGFAPTGYRVWLLPEGGDVTIERVAAESPVVIEGLTNGVSYWVTVSVDTPLQGQYAPHQIVVPCPGGVRCLSPGALSPPERAYTSNQATGYASIMDSTTAADGAVVVSGAFGGQVVLDRGLGLGYSYLLEAAYPIPSQEMYVARYRPDGLLIWARTAGGAGRTYGHSVVTDSEGHVYTASSVMGSLFVDGQNLTPGTQRSHLVAKYDRDTGTLLWTRVLPVSGDASFQYTSFSPGSTGVIISELGGAYLAMNASDQLVLAASSGTSSDGITLRRLDPATGSDVWQVTAASGPGQELPNSVAMDASGNIVLAGLYTQNAQFGQGGSQTTLTGASKTSPFVARYSPTGDLLWALRADGETGALLTDSVVRKTVVGPDGEIFAIGCVGSTASSTPVSSFLSRFSPGGNRDWSTRILGDGFSCVHGLTLDERGGLLAVGEFRDTRSFGAGSSLTTLTSAGGVDGFIARYTTDGVADWAEAVGTTADDTLVSVSFDRTGGRFNLAGVHGNQTLYLGPTPLMATGGVNPFLSRHLYDE